LESMNLSELKQQYRKLQHENHPDKGGKIEMSQSVQHAYTQLRRHINGFG
jgi:DnaJ-class molecular chaperone